MPASACRLGQPAKQTVEHKQFGTLLEYYASLFIDLADSLKSLSSIIVADSYFARKPFMEKITGEGFELVSKLASNAVLLYPYLGPKTGKRGRPKKYNGPVDCLAPCPRHFKSFENEKGLKAFQGKVYIKAFGRMATCVIVHTKRKDGSTRAEVYFSTDLGMDGNETLKAYGLRFQIEFLYRDAKQHTGLSHCQARNREKIHTHINASLTAVSLAKATHHLPEEQRKPFSLSSIKTQYFNEHLLGKFFLAFGMMPEKHKNSNQYQDLYNYGCIAA